jgi:hypothetical protein
LFGSWKIDGEGCDNYDTNQVHNLIAAVWLAIAGDGYLPLDERPVSLLLNIPASKKL